MEIQSGNIPFPTVRGTAQRSSRSLVARQLLLPKPDAGAISPVTQPVSTPARSLTAPSPLQQASLVNSKPASQVPPRQAIATYRAIQQIHQSPDGELLNRIDTRA